MDDNTMIYAVAGGIVCAVVSAIVAERKGYSGLLWAMLGFFTGILGLIGAFIIPDKKKAAREDAARQPNININVAPQIGQPAETQSDRRPCPHCAEMILPNAKVCRYCDRDVTQATI